MVTSKNQSRKIVDTNIIIRIITNDNPKMVAQLQPYLHQVASGQMVLFVETMVIAESVWVLQNLKEPNTQEKLFTREEIANALQALILTPGVETTETNILIQSLRDYANCNVDFVDAYLAAKARLSGDDVLTWNVLDFKKLHIPYDEPKS